MDLKHILATLGGSFLALGVVIAYLNASKSTPNPPSHIAGVRQSEATPGFPNGTVKDSEASNDRLVKWVELPKDIGWAKPQRVRKHREHPIYVEITKTLEGTQSLVIAPVELLENDPIAFNIYAQALADTLTDSADEAWGSAATNALAQQWKRGPLRVLVSGYNYKSPDHPGISAFTVCKAPFIYWKRTPTELESVDLVLVSGAESHLAE